MYRKLIAVILLASTAMTWTAVPTMSADNGTAVEAGKPTDLFAQPPHGERPHPGREHHLQERPRFDPALALARELSATEIHVGIKPGQLEAWRAYTTALLALVESSSSAQPTVPENDGRHDRPGQQVLFAEMFADHAIATGDKARLLKASIKVLMAVLSDEQIERLQRAEPELHPPAPPMPVDGFAPPPEFPIPGND